MTLPDGVQAVQLDYKEKSSIVGALSGVFCVFSFIITGKDPGNVAQKNLIDACVEAKVKRFAPSEWVGLVYHPLWRRLHSPVQRDLF